MPYSGPLSSLSRFGRVEAAYLRKINTSGGINGRQVTLLSLDDAFAPGKTVEQTRKLVESDGVLAIVGSVGTPPNLAIAKYQQQGRAANPCALKHAEARRPRKPALDNYLHDTAAGGNPDLRGVSAQDEA